MSGVLVDTSAWIEAFWGGDIRIKNAVEHLLDQEMVFFCGVIEMELLHGIRPAERKMLIPLFAALRYIEVQRKDWQKAGEILGKLRSGGTAIPSSDALIAALCLRQGMPLLTIDKHFEAIPYLKRYALT